LKRAEKRKVASDKEDNDKRNQLLEIAYEHLRTSNSEVEILAKNGL
jgi:hypothetical protein